MNGPWTILANLPADSTTYTDVIGNVKEGYYYSIFASNTVGDTKTPGFPTKIANSDSSNILSVGISPAAPTNLKARLQQGPQVLLSWRDNANNETGYTIEMSTNPDFTTNLITKIVPANTTTFRTGNLAAKTSYYLRVKAINNIGQSAWVNANPFPIVTP
jgi:hypothetical protein